MWIDTDLALGARRGDVDDGFAVAAVVQAARSGGRDWRGVSAVSGNTDGATALDCLRRLLGVLGGDAGRPVLAEADAPAALAALPAGASILALGPPTSLVKAARLDPCFPPRVEVRVVGSVRDRLRHPLLPLFDLNFRTDPASSRAFWSLPFRRRLVFPLDVVRRLRIDGRHLDRLAAAGPVGDYLARHSRRWLSRARLVHLSRSFPVWDLVPALEAVGRLPGARWEGHVLASFDPGGAREAFFALMDGA